MAVVLYINAKDIVALGFLITLALFFGVLALIDWWNGRRR